MELSDEKERFQKVKDIAPHFRWNFIDACIGEEILKYEATPEAIKKFAAKCDQLTDYGYWFLLSTLWVSYSDFSDLNLWKELFSSPRPKRRASLMKPSELRAFERLPYFNTAYRAHRLGETDWIAYTLQFDKAAIFAREREVKEIAEYEVQKKHILALFLRRGEEEIIVLDKSKPKFVRMIPLAEAES